MKEDEQLWEAFKGKKRKRDFLSRLSFDRTIRLADVAIFASVLVALVSVIPTFIGTYFQLRSLNLATREVVELQELRNEDLAIRTHINEMNDIISQNLWLSSSQSRIATTALSRSLVAVNLMLDKSLIIDGQLRVDPNLSASLLRLNEALSTFSATDQAKQTEILEVSEAFERKQNDLFAADTSDAEYFEAVLEGLNRYQSRLNEIGVRYDRDIQEALQRLQKGQKQLDEAILFYAKPIPFAP